MPKFGKKMSKVGQVPVVIPAGVKVELEKDTLVTTGVKGSLKIKLPQRIEVEVKEDAIFVKPGRKDSKTRALHGTFRALIANNVKGVSEGWTKSLELVGTGYRAELNGDDLVLTIGFSHPVKVQPPAGISFTVEKSKVTVSGVDKALVGQVAAQVRAVRPPEPYKGKGIRYEDEIVRRKPGKAAKAQGAVGA